MGNTRHFLARYGMRGHELTDVGAQRGLGGLDYVLLGGANVHDNGLGRQTVGNAAQHRFRGSHRHGDHYQVGMRRRIGRAVGGFMDHARLQRRLQSAFARAVGHHMAHQAGALHGQSQRAAHQAATDQCQAVEHGVYPLMLLIA